MVKVVMEIESTEDFTKEDLEVYAAEIEADFKAEPRISKYSLSLIKVTGEGDERREETLLVLEHKK